jgi:pyridoxal/pyridoxine/pyridoxamine kinase
MLNKNQIPYFTGTGDLLAAMLLAHEEKNENDFGKTIETAVNIVNSVLVKSCEFPMIGKDEISLVASKNDIEFP